jgi:hypothetical protein
MRVIVVLHSPPLFVSPSVVVPVPLFLWSSDFASAAAGAAAEPPQVQGKKKAFTKYLKNKPL